MTTAFTSMDIIKGAEFEAVFTIMEDDGLTVHTLSSMTSAIFTLTPNNSTSDDNTSIHTMTKVGNTDGSYSVRLYLSASTVAELIAVRDGRDSQFLARSNYSGSIVVSFTDKPSVNAHIDKIRLL